VKLFFHNAPADKFLPSYAGTRRNMQDAGLMLSAYMIYFQLKERESKRGT
jgi:hypothetical protein